ncbi:type II secretion system secretin GspD [Pseudomaricurvus alkylphenolicus]|jgi:general secretion pathway protein D|uniref:type II secretion system secretin GspD n=1 Tax=Pseudomaricurvus alkylphenolicus TaxID=1306991 RepID=UPI00141FC4DF|nr:type II secretion system secretin GspD [Pseudomaricurvus alkylphenolicus]NIB41423.1 type II secretion system secretin GspD [Pseudomaricurvus alkylphenolicus]
MMKNWSPFILLLSLICLLPTASADDHTVSINFRDAEIRSVIESVAEVTGKSFVLDPRVKGKLSIISPQPIEKDLFYEVFLSALQVQGFQAADDGAVVRIVPFTKAFDVPGGDAGNQIETHVIPVEHSRAPDLLPSLRPLMSKGARIQAHEFSNHIIATDTRAQLRRIGEVLKEIDTPDQSAMEIIELDHLSTGEALYIISQMKVIDQQKISIVEDELNNRIIISGPSIDRRRFGNLLASLDVPTRSQDSGVEVIYLNYSSAEDLKAILTNMLQSSTFQFISGADAKAPTSKYKIEADKGNNALIVAAPQAVTSKLKSIVRKLDRPREQVLIEAVVAEISEDKARELSVQLASVSENGGYLTNYSTILPVLSALATEDREDAVAKLGTTLQNQTGLNAAGGNLDSDGHGIAALIRALQSDSDTNILSTPSVVTLDNEEAELSVGQQVPFITGSFTSSNNSVDNPFQTIQREDVGVQLKVTPQINEDDSVKLAIEQESSNLLASAETLGTADVVTARRSISTNVVVGNNQLLVLGGLIGDDFSISESKVPLLGDIPVLGHLFKSKSRQATSRVLMIFIRPTVITDTQTARNVTNKRYRYIRERQLEQRDGTTSSIPYTVTESDKQLGIE